MPDAAGIGKEYIRKHQLYNMLRLKNPKYLYHFLVYVVKCIFFAAQNQ